MIGANLFSARESRVTGPQQSWSGQPECWCSSHSLIQTWTNADLISWRAWLITSHFPSLAISIRYLNHPDWFPYRHTGMAVEESREVDEQWASELFPLISQQLPDKFLSKSSTQKETCHALILSGYPCSLRVPLSPVPGNMDYSKQSWLNFSGNVF